MKKSHAIVAVLIAGVMPISLGACAASSPDSGDSGPLKLTLEDYYASATAKSAIIKIYNQCAKDNGVELTINHVPPATYVSKVLQQSSSKTLPDILMLDNPTVQQIAATGALSPLGDYGITGENVAPGVVAAASYEGELYAAIPAANSLALFYNKDMFEQAGLQPPTSWAELADTAKALTTAEHYGFAFSGSADAQGTFQLVPFMWSNGGDETELESPENAQALEFLTDLVQDGSASESVTVWGMGDVQNQFVAGKAAMMINGPWNIPGLKATEGLNWDYVEIPTRKSSQTSQAPLGGEGFAVPNTGSADKMAAAGKIVACINSPKNQALNATENFTVPTDLTAAEEFGAKDETFATFVSIIADARARTGKLGADWPAVEAQIYSAEQLALTGKASPDEAFAQAAAQ